MITMCCVCGKVRNEVRGEVHGEESWSMPGSPILADEMLSHGYCPPCASAFLQDVDRDYGKLNGTVTLAGAWNSYRRDLVNGDDASSS